MWNIPFAIFVASCAIIEGFHFVAPVSNSMLNERQATQRGCGTSAKGQGKHVHQVQQRNRETPEIYPLLWYKMSLDTLTPTME